MPPPRRLFQVLAAYLLVWPPLSFAAELSSTLPSLGLRGPVASLELAAHAAVAALAVAGGWALWSGEPHGIVLGRAALVCTALVSIQSHYWSILPSQTRPGDELPLAIIAVAHAGAWLLYLQRQRG